MVSLPIQGYTQPEYTEASFKGFQFQCSFGLAWKGFRIAA